MYREHFRFRETPFSIAPDPRYLFMSDRHREALAHLVYGLRSDGGFVLLTGEVGTGKTTLCRCLLKQIPEDVEVAFVLNPKLTAAELLATICDELRIVYPEPGTSIKDLVDRINRRLLSNHGAGRRTILILDEAQNLDTEVLEQIRLLTNLETSERKLLQIIMLGQPELRAKLARPELRQLAQRITARYHLEGLTRKEVRLYIDHRLKVAGVRRPLFSAPALSRIYRLSKGIPRRINVLCDRALLGAYVSGRDRVSARIVTRAAREVYDSPRSGAVAGWLGMGGLAAAGVLLALVIPDYLHRGLPPELSPESPAIAASSVLTPMDASAEVSGWTAEKIAGDRQQAFAGLLRLWGLEYDPAAGEACEWAEEQGLGCISRQDSFQVLRGLDRPAVLTFSREDGERFYGILTGLEGERGTFFFDGAPYRLSLEKIMPHWSGEYVLFWRRPAFGDVLRPGDTGEGVQWLDAHLGLALGQAPLNQNILEGELLQRLKRFQFSRKLTPDGLAGPFTLIHLQSALGQEAPTLVADSEVN